LYTSCEHQIDQFLIGLYEVIPKTYFKIFDHNEIELFLFGCSMDSLKDPIGDWIHHTKYSGYSLESPIIKWFWEIIQTLNSIQKAKVLQYVTGTTSLPSNGFKGIHPEFEISKLYSKENGINGHHDLNRLDLPEYQTKNELEIELIKKLKL